MSRLARRRAEEPEVTTGEPEDITEVARPTDEGSVEPIDTQEEDATINP